MVFPKAAIDLFCFKRELVDALFIYSNKSPHEIIRFLLICLIRCEQMRAPPSTENYNSQSLVQNIAFLLRYCSFSYLLQLQTLQGIFCTLSKFSFMGAVIVYRTNLNKAFPFLTVGDEVVYCL